VCAADGVVRIRYWRTGGMSTLSQHRFRHLILYILSKGREGLSVGVASFEIGDSARAGISFPLSYS
jgi:hypothetical protein